MFLPIRDDNPHTVTPFVNYTMLAICIVVYVWQFSLGAEDEQLAVLTYGFTPAYFFGPGAPAELAAVPATLTMFTSMFMHGGWMHLGFNLLFLHSLGPVLEDTIGAKRFTLLYLGSGAFGGAVHLMGALLSPRIFGHPVVGASAGLCGLLSALCAIYAEEPMELRLLFLLPVVMRAKFLLLGTALMSMAGTVLPFGNVAHLAHLGGLIGGLLCLNFMDVKPLELEPPPAPPPGR